MDSETNFLEMQLILLLFIIKCLTLVAWKTRSPLIDKKLNFVILLYAFVNLLRRLSHGKKFFLTKDKEDKI